MNLSGINRSPTGVRSSLRLSRMGSSNRMAVKPRPNLTGSNRMDRLLVPANRTRDSRAMGRIQDSRLMVRIPVTVNRVRLPMALRPRVRRPTRQGHRPVDFPTTSLERFATSWALSRE
jgi:hypothetical protein